MGISVSVHRNKDSSQLSVVRRFAKQSSKIASLHSKEDQFDDVLESEIRAEHEKPKNKFQKFRVKGKHLLHSKYVLVVVVALCVLDCVLVIGELILDMHAIKEAAGGDHGSSHDIDNSSAALAYKSHHSDIVTPHNSSIHRRAADAHVAYSEITHGPPYSHGGNSSAEGGDHAGDHGGGHHEHSIQQKIAHALHYASITILAILVCYTMMKILFQGREFITKKIEVFDAIVVIASFVIDLAFLEGITTLPIRESAYILSFILPWRVIRVVNSLVVAVLDHEHFKLLLVYKSKKYLKTQLDEMKDDVALMRKQLHMVKAMCIEAGAQEWTINQSLMKIANQVQKKKKQALSSFASLTAGAMVDEKRSFRTSMRKRIPVTDAEESKKLITPRPSNGTLDNVPVSNGGEKIQHSTNDRVSNVGANDRVSNVGANDRVSNVGGDGGAMGTTPTPAQVEPVKTQRPTSFHVDAPDINFADDDE